VQQNVNDEEDFEFMTLDLPFFAVWVLVYSLWLPWLPWLSLFSAKILLFFLVSLYSFTCRYNSSNFSLSPRIISLCWNWFLWMRDGVRSRFLRAVDTARRKVFDDLERTLIVEDVLREFDVAYQVRVRLVPLLRMHCRNQHYQKQQHPMHSLEHSNIYNIKKQTYHKTVKIIIQSLNSKGEYWSSGSYSRCLTFGLC
jgi:hypothetical protein